MYHLIEVAWCLSQLFPNKRLATLGRARMMCMASSAAGLQLAISECGRFGSQCVKVCQTIVQGPYQDDGTDSFQTHNRVLKTLCATKRMTNPSMYYED